MLKEEFYKLTGINLTEEEYRKVEEVYNSCVMVKDEFCRIWKDNRKNEGVNRLIGELMDTIRKYENDIKSLKEENSALSRDCTSLINENKEIRAEHSVEMQNNELQFRNHMRSFAEGLIKAGYEDMPASIYDVIKEKFGVDFIILTKRKYGIALHDSEIEYMVQILTQRGNG